MRKRKTCCVGNKDKFSKWDLIDLISNCSNKYGDKLAEFLGMYHLCGLREATEEQLSEYIKYAHLQPVSPEKTM